MFAKLQVMFRKWRDLREARRLVRGTVRGFAAMVAEEERLCGTWFCDLCKHEGGLPEEATITWELSANRLFRLADCPSCGVHSFELGGDEGEPVPDDYPLPGFDGQGPCPMCGSTDTIPIVRGRPTELAFLAASRGRARLAGCVLILPADGSDPTHSLCKACEAEW